MIEIYAVKLPEKPDNATIDKLISCLPEVKQTRIKRFRHFRDSLRTLSSEILVRSVVQEKTHLKNEQLIFTVSKYGKPLLENIEDLYFNSAHSGEWAVCAVDCEPIGVDIERIRGVDFSIAEFRFSKEEYKDLMEKDENERLLYLYDLWTLKESYIKAVGKGLSIPLDSFTIRKDAGDITLENSNDCNIYYFKQYNIDVNYKLSVCASNRVFPADVVIKRFQDISMNILNS